MKFEDLLNVLELQGGFSGDTELFVYPSIENHSEADESFYRGKYNDIKKSVQYRLYAKNVVKSWEMLPGGGVKITLDGERYLPNQKFSFEIQTSDGESYTSGKIILTYEQALAVEYASNEDNWTNKVDYGYNHGSLTIDIDSAVPVDNE